MEAAFAPPDVRRNRGDKLHRNLVVDRSAGAYSWPELLRSVGIEVMRTATVNLQGDIGCFVEQT